MLLLLLLATVAAALASNSVVIPIKYTVPAYTVIFNELVGTSLVAINLALTNENKDASEILELVELGNPIASSFAITLTFLIEDTEL